MFYTPSCFFFLSLGKAAIKALRVAQSGTLAELEALQEEEVTRAHGVVLKKDEMALAEDKRVLEVFACYLRSYF